MQSTTKAIYKRKVHKSENLQYRHKLSVITVNLSQTKYILKSEKHHEVWI